MNARVNKKTPPDSRSDDYPYEPMFSETFVRALSEIFFDD